MELGGYAGSILYVDLAGREPGEKVSLRKESLDPALARKFLGGRGLGAYFLYKLAGPDVNPLDPENPFILGTGPFTGTSLPGSKYVVMTKSPLTGTFLDSYAGGEIAGEIKYAGYDMIIIQGKAARPSILLIQDDKVELRDASDVWGMQALDAEKRLKEILGDEAKMMVVGIAGENMVPFSCICSDYYHQAGRGGAGAVLGSKKLKAVAVVGTKGLKVADAKGLRDMRHDFHRRLDGSKIGELRVTYGTSYTTVAANTIGFFPTRNFQQSTFEEISGLDCYAMREKIWQSNHGCLGCIAPCMNFVEGHHVKVRLVGPEYETISLLGSNIGIGDIEWVAYFNELCDGYGMDTISTGNVIGFAMECFERGLIDKNDTDGLELRFGNAEAVSELIPKIAHREGFGALLSEGVRNVANKIGQGSERFAMHTKGLEFPAYEPRGAFAMGLAYAVASRGGCHRRAKPVEMPQSKFPHDEYGYKGNSDMVVRLQNFREPVHCGILCDALLRFGIEADLGDIAKLYQFTVGWKNVDAEELSELGHRIYTLSRCYNIREGFSRRDDALPYRTMYEPLPDGPGKGKSIGDENFKIMLEEYYEARGWDKETGVPTKETLDRLGLSDIVGSDFDPSA
jgi:aldehyde:ferredoxin oxidoreductase